MVSKWWEEESEEFLRGLLEEGAKKYGFTLVKWKGRDEKQEFFLYPRDLEMDILVKGEKMIAVEIQPFLTKARVEDFERRIRLYEKVENGKFDEKYIVTVGSYPDAEEYAQALGIKFVSDPKEIVSKEI